MGKGNISLRKRRWLLRLLNWPVIWRWAVDWACEYEHADESDCLPCAASKRRNRHEHRLAYGPRRVLQCLKCGRDVDYCTKHRHCSRKRASVPTPTSLKPVYSITPVFWD